MHSGLCPPASIILWVRSLRRAWQKTESVRGWPSTTREGERGREACRMYMWRVSTKLTSSASILQVNNGVGVKRDEGGAGGGLGYSLHRSCHAFRKIIRSGVLFGSKMFCSIARVQ